MTIVLDHVEQELPTTEIPVQSMDLSVDADVQLDEGIDIHLSNRVTNEVDWEIVEFAETDAGLAHVETFPCCFVLRHERVLALLI